MYAYARIVPRIYTRILASSHTCLNHFDNSIDTIQSTAIDIKGLDNLIYILYGKISSH